MLFCTCLKLNNWIINKLILCLIFFSSNLSSLCVYLPYYSSASNSFILSWKSCDECSLPSQQGPSAVSQHRWTSTAKVRSQSPLDLNSSSQNMDQKKRMLDNRIAECQIVCQNIFIMKWLLCQRECPVLIINKLIIMNAIQECQIIINECQMIIMIWVQVQH